MIITVPAFMALWTNHDVLNHHFIRYTKRDFRAVARQAGLQTQEERYLYHWTFPVKMGVRLMEASFGQNLSHPRSPPAGRTTSFFGRHV